MDYFHNLRKIKWFFQRLFRGYSDCDIWGLDLHLSKIMLKRVRAFRQLKHNGYPASLNSLKEWHDILDKIIFALYYASTDYGMEEEFMYHDEIFQLTEEKQELYKIDGKSYFSNRKFNKEKAEYYDSKYKEGMKLLAEYFSMLGD